MHYIKKLLKLVITPVTHFIGNFTKRYYFEDNIRVYDYNLNKQNSKRLNFINHRKVYKFSEQFVKGKICLDAGCGSGYGSNILSKEAKKVYGIDASSKSLKYAKSSYKNIDFERMFLPKLSFPDSFFDLCICSEVLEHLKEYSKEGDTVRELKRVLKPNGIMILATPNIELLNNHGFGYEELKSLLDKNFNNVAFFENSLIPRDKALWEYRLNNNKHGLIYTKNINLNETCQGAEHDNKLKESNINDPYGFDNIQIQLKELHNTHSFLAVCKN